MRSTLIRMNTEKATNNKLDSKLSANCKQCSKRHCSWKLQLVISYVKICFICKEKKKMNVNHDDEQYPKILLDVSCSDYDFMWFCFIFSIYIYSLPQTDIIIFLKSCYLFSSFLPTTHFFLNIFDYLFTRMLRCRRK